MPKGKPRLKAKSKSQKRLAGMALAYRRGELPKDKAYPAVIQMSELPIADLESMVDTDTSKALETVDEGLTLRPIISKLRTSLNENDDASGYRNIIDYLKGERQELVKAKNRSIDMLNKINTNQNQIEIIMNSYDKTIEIIDGYMDILLDRDQDELYR